MANAPSSAVTRWLERLRSSRGGAQPKRSLRSSEGPFRGGNFGRALFPGTNLRTGAVFWRSFPARCPLAGTKKPFPGDRKSLVNGRWLIRAVFWHSFPARCPPAGTEQPLPGDRKPPVNGRCLIRNTAMESARIFGKTPPQTSPMQVYGGISGELLPLHAANPYRKTNSSNFLIVRRLRNGTGEESEV